MTRVMSDGEIYGKLKFLKTLSFHSVFATEFDLLHCSVIHTASTEHNVTLSQEIIPGFHIFAGLTPLSKVQGMTMDV